MIDSDMFRFKTLKINNTRKNHLFKSKKNAEVIQCLKEIDLHYESESLCQRLLAYVTLNEGVISEVFFL